MYRLKDRQLVRSHTVATATYNRKNHELFGLKSSPNKQTKSENESQILLKKFIFQLISFLHCITINERHMTFIMYSQKKEKKNKLKHKRSFIYLNQLI